MTNPDPEIRARFEKDRRAKRREREVLVGDPRKTNGAGIGALWRRLPMFVRQSAVALGLITTGFIARDRIGTLEAERVTYKALVDTLRLDVDTLEAKTANFDPFARYMLCWTARQTTERSVDGCERSLIGTPLWAVLQEETRTPRERRDP